MLWFFALLHASELTYADLSSTQPLLIFIYYERPGLVCPLCSIVYDHLLQISNIEKRKINFYDDPFLASKFLTVFFPSLIILDHQKTHHLDVFMEIEQLQELIDKKTWSHENCNSWRNNPSGKLALPYSYMTYGTFYLMKICYKVASKVPGYVVSITLGLMAACLVIIVIQLITSEIKQKRE